ncbi:MAG TPA: DNA polymerase III subunit delta' [Stellaceae bacterium]|nr:DNA polymerase III subunit delta' [Stellaceae bacterium]
MSERGDPARTAPAPRANPDLLGHETVERELRRLVAAGRLPHALLICGPRGIGKATLAFRLARYVLAHGAGENASPALAGAGEGLAIPPDSGTFRRVAAGGHADLLTVERAWDPRRRRLRGEIVIDDTREIAQFLRLTPAEGGWRVVVVDGADEMNRNAANALLKVLEEPPSRALLLLVAHSPGRLLPTLRSRCRRLALAPLAPAIVRRLLTCHRPDLPEAQIDELAALTDGSIGRALDLAAAGGGELYHAIVELLTRDDGIDAVALHGFADRLARAEADEAYRAAADLLARIVGGLALAAAGGGAGEGPPLDRLAARVPASRWAEIRAEVDENFSRTDGLNLDRKQAILGAFFAIAAAAR